MLPGRHEGNYTARYITNGQCGTILSAQRLNYVIRAPTVIGSIRQKTEGFPTKRCSMSTYDFWARSTAKRYEVVLLVRVKIFCLLYRVVVEIFLKILWCECQFHDVGKIIVAESMLIFRNLSGLSFACTAISLRNHLILKQFFPN